ncbi:MAG: diguanylate cyclase [Clostridiales bacterium]|mgnify:CR=1 FL=1|nr:diguanylate cyclase [Clostridiales bacterium]
MKDGQTRAAVAQWLIPAIVLIVVVIVMLFNFSAKSSQSAAEEVENRMVDVVEKYAIKIKYELASMANAGKPVGHLMGEYIAFNGGFSAKMASVLKDNTKAYAIIYCDSGENGMDQNAIKVNLKDLSYFAEIFEEAAGGNTSDADEQMAADNKAVKYVYVKDDEIGMGKEAVVAVISLDTEKGSDKLLMYYPIDNFKGLFKKTEFDADAFYFLINPDGTIMETTDYESEFLKGDNIWTTIEQSGKYDEAIAKAMIRMKSKASGSFSAVVNGEARKFVYAPVGINKWTLVAGVNQSYADNLQAREWGNAKQMIYQLVVAIWVFLGLIVVINIIDKIKSTEKSKELGEIADTDLLTSLNNKLATERKIKEWMEKNPNEQGLMFVLDIDNFKKINDTLGHAFGDEVLRSLGHQIGSIFRATDVIGRTGGDEFTIFLKHLNDDALLEREAKKLCNFFENFQAGEYVKYMVTASIGAAVFPRDGKDFESLYKAADNALYSAKKRGKNQLAFYGDDE